MMFFSLPVKLYKPISQCKKLRQRMVASHFSHFLENYERTTKKKILHLLCFKGWRLIPLSDITYITTDEKVSLRITTHLWVAGYCSKITSCYVLRDQMNCRNFCYVSRSCLKASWAHRSKTTEAHSGLWHLILCFAVCEPSWHH